MISKIFSLCLGIIGIGKLKTLKGKKLKFGLPKVPILEYHLAHGGGSEGRRNEEQGANL